MEYVDKSKSRQWAHRLIRTFLMKRLEEGYAACSSDLYESFRTDKKCKDAFVERLLEDSGHRCCYCMRDIRGTTLEHVIPKSVESREEFDKYFLMESDLDKENIMLESDFLAHPKDVPPFPHTIAYENLVPSCFGNIPGGSPKCCNLFRGDKALYPLMFRRHISEEVRYRTDGTISWKEDPEPVVPTITKLGLDCPELKVIRKIWYYLSSHGLSCDDANRVSTIEILLDDLGDDPGREMLQNFMKPEYWKMLSNYTYFNDKSRFTE